MSVSNNEKVKYNKNMKNLIIYYDRDFCFVNFASELTVSIFIDSDKM